MADKQPEKAADGGTKEYILDKKSRVGAVEVDNKTVTMHESASLTQDQYDRASALEGVKLVEAGKDDS